MTEKILGKINFAEFGTFKDYPFLIGLQLGFIFSDGTGIMTGGRYTTHINSTVELEKRIRCINVILKEAKVQYISQLIGKPVEVTIDNNTFKDFRILTEVL